MTSDYLPALRFQALTRFYDPIVRFTTRERAVKNALIDAAHISEGATVVDVGCGTGTLAIALKQRYPTARVVGLDADPAVLRQAEVKATKAGVDVEFVHGNATAMPLDDGVADRVVSSLFFHHLDHDAKHKALAEIKRVLRSGGELHIADWGAPANGLMRLLFLPVRILDGFAPTDDNVHGRLPAIIQQAVGRDVTETATFATIFGTLTLLAAGQSPTVEASSI